MHRSPRPRLAQHVLAALTGLVVVAILSNGAPSLGAYPSLGTPGARLRSFVPLVPRNSAPAYPYPAPAPATTPSPTTESPPATATSTPAATSTPVACNGWQQLLLNPSFETGTAPWTFLGLAYRDTRRAYDGAYAAFFGGYNNANDFVAQSAVVPSWAETAALYFSWNMGSLDSTVGGYDRLRMAVFDPSNNFLTDNAIWNNGLRNTWVSWRVSVGDVRRFRGALLTPAFQASTDGSAITSWWVDKVWLVFACGSTPAESLAAAGAGSAPPSGAGAGPEALENRARAAGRSADEGSAVAAIRDAMRRTTPPRETPIAR